MTIRVAINGYGRIGRNILRALYEAKPKKDIQIVAINDMGTLEANVLLTKYDTTHGRFAAEVDTDGEDIIVNGERIKACCEPDPSKLPWGNLGIDIVFECTGRFANREGADKHLAAGAKKVIISAPAGADVDATIVYGVNHQILKAGDKIISNASCTTNCLAPLAKVLHENIGIETGLMNTIHAYTNDQMLVDSHHKDLRRARSATQSIIPTKTGAAAAVGLVLPELDGRLDGFALRVPTINVSLVDLTFTPSRTTTVEEINRIVTEAANGKLNGVLEVNDLPLVSCDFNHNPASCIFDATQTKVMGNLVKVLAWYDNEWGFSNRMLDVTVALMAAEK